MLLCKRVSACRFQYTVPNRGMLVKQPPSTCPSNEAYQAQVAYESLEQGNVELRPIGLVSSKRPKQGAMDLRWQEKLVVVPGFCVGHRKQVRFNATQCPDSTGQNVCKFPCSWSQPCYRRQPYRHSPARPCRRQMQVVATSSHTGHSSLHVS